MPTTRTKKADTGATPAAKAKKPAARKATPEVKAKKGVAPPKTAAKKRTLAVVQAGRPSAPRRGARYLVVVESPAKA